MGWIVTDGEIWASCPGSPAGTPGYTRKRDEAFVFGRKEDAEEEAREYWTSGVRVEEVDVDRNPIVPAKKADSSKGKVVLEYWLVRLTFRDKAHWACGGVRTTEDKRLAYCFASRKEALAEAAEWSEQQDPRIVHVIRRKPRVNVEARIREAVLAERERIVRFTMTCGYVAVADKIRSLP